MGTEMKQRRGYDADWISTNPILGDGEIGFARDTHVMKIGDGATHWNDLAGFNGPTGPTGPTGPAGPAGPAGAFGSALSIYGTGSAGALVFDGTSTVAGATRSGTTYTLTGDIHATNMTVNSGVTIITHGYVIHCTGTLTNNGTIHNSIGIGGAQNSGAPSGTLSGGGTGGANDIPGSTTSAPLVYFGGLGGTGGGSGVGVGGATGGSGYKLTPPNPPKDLTTAIGYLNLLSMGLALGGAGGGGGHTVSGQAGFGGGGGGVVLIFAKLVAGTGAIHARGSAGLIGVTGPNAGGGGGGGGGSVVIMTTSTSTGTIAGQTIDANGGAGGAGTGTQAAGAAGNAGTISLIPG